MRKSMIAALVATLALGGCASTDPYTGEQKGSNAAVGSLVGAIGGAIVGAASSSKGDREKGIITGVLAGAAAGGGIGYYMDRQEAQLRQKLAGTGVSVARDGDNIQLVMPSNLTFGVNSSTLTGSAVSTLSGVALVVAEFDQTNLQITGHTDSTGTRELNMNLSQQRANSVATELLRNKVDSSRMSIYGAGPDRPIASNTTEAGRAQNRRVEIFLTPRT